MEHAWLKREGARDLVLFMLGWGATPNAVLHIHPPGCDVLAFYNYTDIPPPVPAEMTAGYRRVYLIAWSFGVWVAEQCCQHLPLHKAIALNGTPFPSDPRYGLRLRVLLRTMRGIAKAGGVNPFADKSQEGTRYIPSGPYPERSAEEMVDELQRLADWSASSSTARIPWDKAFIATRDEIFPPANMRAYWATVGLGTEFDSFHYPFADPALILAEI